MVEDDLKRDRSSTRLATSIPIVISGVDADGNNFSESVHTLVVNKHGGKIATTHQLAMGTEILIENRTLGVKAKAHVVWLGEKRYPGDLHRVGLQLLEAQNVWGIAFPPHDWRYAQGEEAIPKPEGPAAQEASSTEGAASPAPSLAVEEITLRLMQELQQSADAHAKEFQDRLKQLTQRLGMELELDLRDRVAYARAREMGALDEAIRVLEENLSAAREEMGKLEAKIEELKPGLEAATEKPPLPSLQEARQQLTALTKSVVESMNQAAEAGLSEYRRLLQKENQERAARLGAGAEENPPPGSATARS